MSLDAGLTYSNLKANLSNLVDATYTPRVGFGVNLRGDLEVKGPLFVSLGLSFVQKNYRYTRTGGLSEMYSKSTYLDWYTNYDNGFLSVPVSVGVYVYKSRHLVAKLRAGGFMDYWLSRHASGQYPAFASLQPSGATLIEKSSERYDFKKNPYELSRVLFGWQAQGQLEYSVDEKIDILGGVSYQQGLTDIHASNKDKNRKATVQSYLFSLGVAYKF